MPLLTDTSFIAFDLETTGMSAHMDRIVEFGAVRFRPHQEVDAIFDQLVDPERSIPAAVSRIHGIYDRDIVGKPNIDEILPAWNQFIEFETPILIAHNASFDRGFLAAAYALTGRDSPTNPIICSLPLFRLAWPEFSNYKLETIGRNLNLIDDESHRGLADSVLLMNCFNLALAELTDLKTTDQLLSVTKPFQFSDSNFSQARPPQAFSELQAAIEEEHLVEMEYGEYRGKPRRVTPISIFRVKEIYYLIAHCHIDDFEKQFRLDRIHKFTVLVN